MIVWGRKENINKGATWNPHFPDATSSVILANFKVLFKCVLSSQFPLTFANPVNLSFVHCSSLVSWCDVKFSSLPMPSSDATQFSDAATARHSNHLLELSSKAQTSIAATSLNWCEMQLEILGRHFKMATMEKSLKSVVSRHEPAPTWVFQFAGWTGLGGRLFRLVIMSNQTIIIIRIVYYV